MGQAKKRGTYEERKAEGIQKSENIAAENKRRYAEWEASLTQEQRNSRKNAQVVMNVALGIGAASRFKG